MSSRLEKKFCIDCLVTSYKTYFGGPNHSITGLMLKVHFQLASIKKKNNNKKTEGLQQSCLQSVLKFSFQ